GSPARFAGGSTAPHFWRGPAGRRRRRRAPERRARPWRANSSRGSSSAVRVACGWRSPRPAGDRLAVKAGIGETDEDVPPVVKQRKQSGGEPATGEIVRCIAAPAPLVLHLVENVLSVAPVAIELTECFHIFIERSDQNRVFVDFRRFFRRFADLGERQLRRTAIVVHAKPHGVLQAPP